MTRVIGSDEECEVSLLAEDQYFRHVHWTPALTQEEEQGLFERIVRGKAEQRKACPDRVVLEEARRARDRLVEGYQRLVVFIARKYAHRFRSLELLDLVQEGNLGLLDAITYHDPRKGYRFSTIAGRYIRQALWAALCDRDRTIRVSNRVNDCLNKARKVQRQLLHRLGREPELVELAEEIGIPVERLEDYLDLDERAEVTSVQVLLREAERGEGGGEDYLALVDVYADWVRAEAHQVTEREQALRCAIEGVLTESQRQVISLRYGLVEGEECPRSLSETAAVVGKRAVGRHESQAKQRLYRALAPVMGLSEELLAS